MTINIWIAIMLVVSMIINLFLIWFAREQSSRITYVSENVGDLVELIASYRDHLKAIYDLDTYYGDENIRFLFDHTRSLIEIIEEEYSDVTSLTEPLQIDAEEFEDTEKDLNEEIKPYGENVFYAGSRERNN